MKDRDMPSIAFDDFSRVLAGGAGLLTTLLVVAAAISCGPEDPAVCLKPDFEAPDGSTYCGGRCTVGPFEGTRNEEPDDCSAGEYCLKVNTQLEGNGRCVAESWACDHDVEPACWESEEQTADSGQASEKRQCSEGCAHPPSPSRNVDRSSCDHPELSGEFAYEGGCAIVGPSREACPGEYCECQGVGCPDPGADSELPEPTTVRFCDEQEVV
jgi:hypothetical protein